MVASAGTEATMSGSVPAFALAWHTFGNRDR
jgi:hypothetical protein